MNYCNMLIIHYECGTSDWKKKKDSFLVLKYMQITDT